MALLGYARVSTLEQDPALQLDALAAAGYERVFTGKASGALDERPELARTAVEGGQSRSGWEAQAALPSVAGEASIDFRRAAVDGSAG